MSPVKGGTTRGVVKLDENKVESRATDKVAEVSIRESALGGSR